MVKSEDIPNCPTLPTPKPDAETHDYHIELITPMFGGGVEARYNDTSFPIRPTSIRGHLEFWWRATVGAKYVTVGELYASHADVWGSTTKASPVQIIVEDVTNSHPTPCAHYELVPHQPDTYKSTPKWCRPFQNTSLAYVLFPFKGKLSPSRQSVEVDPDKYISKASFRLRIRCPIELWPQVEIALWAWINFGGLGARTRRGCGSIIGRPIANNGELVKELAPRDANDLATQFKQKIPKKHPARDWPTLAISLLAGHECSDAIEAWDNVISLFQSFRQGRGIARNSGQVSGNPGRSRFPEPDTIRHATRRSIKKHTPDENMPNAFPRAEFGLPIVFHFKDKSDPADTTLYPSNGRDGKKRERMASPIILKALATSTGTWLPLLLQLNTHSLSGVDLRRKPDEGHDDEKSLELAEPTYVRHPSLARYPSNSPLARSSNGSAIEAFLAYVRENGFKEVPL